MNKMKKNILIDYKINNIRTNARYDCFVILCWWI